MWPRLAACMVLLFAFGTGCGSSPTAHRLDYVLAGQEEKKIEIQVLGSVAKACDIDPARTYFAYNDDGLDAHSMAVLREIAECMSQGPLLGRAVLVTGHTDITGTRAYNRELGLARGEAVAVELMRHGVCPERIYVRSKGEEGARPDTEVMAFDRRVELSLVRRD